MTAPKKKLTAAEVQAQLAALDTDASVTELAPFVAVLPESTVDDPTKPLLPSSAAAPSLHAPLSIREPEVQVVVPPSVLRVTQDFPYRMRGHLHHAKKGSLIHRDHFEPAVWEAILLRRRQCWVDATPLAAVVAGGS